MHLCSKSLQNTCKEFNLLKIDSSVGIFQGFWPQDTAPIFVEHLSMAYSNKWFYRIGSGKGYYFCVSMKIDILNRFLTYLLQIARELQIWYSRLTTNTVAFRYSRKKTSQCFIIHEKPSDSDNSNERECVTKMTYNNSFCLRKKSYKLVAKSQNWRPLIISIKRQSSLYTCNEWL